MASNRNDPKDPYAPPPMYHDRSGRVVRLGLLAVLLAALGVGYFAWSAGNTQQSAALAPPAQQQQLADASGYYRAQPERMPQAQPVAPTPQATAPAPTRRSTPTRSSRTYSAPPTESAPPPVSQAPTTPAPTTPQMPDTTPPTQG